MTCERIEVDQKGDFHCTRMFFSDGSSLSCPSIYMNRELISRAVGMNKEEAIDHVRFECNHRRSLPGMELYDLA